MVTDSADLGATGHAVGVATMNAAWAVEAAGGAVAVARLADTAGFVLPYVLIGGDCPASAVVVFVSCYARSSRSSSEESLAATELSEIP